MRTRTRENRKIRLVVLAVVGTLIGGASPSLRGQGTKWGLRGEVMGKQGMVASGHPLASLAGLRMLAKGGNAVDAIVAMAAALSVVEPEMSGLGGVGYMLLYSAKESRVRALPFGGRSAAAAKLEFYTRQTTTDGPKAPLVPGNPAGWAKALKDYGSLPLSEVLQPAIELAEQGHLVNSVQARRREQSLPRLKASADTAAVYLKQIDSSAPHAYKEGELFVNQAQARVLKRIAAEGTDVFYKGEIAQEMARALERDGGLIRLSDLASYPETVQWQDPLAIAYRGYTVYAAPPPNSGIQMLQTLKIMEGFDVRAMGHHSVDYLTRLMEAIRIARVDTDKYVADPRFATIPVKTMLSDAHIAQHRAYVAEKLKPGTSPSGSLVSRAETPVEERLYQSTTFLVAGDRWGNAVNLTTTLGSAYGSAYMPGRVGFTLNNGSRWFHLTPGHPNVLAASKDVEWCIAPIQVHKSGKPYLVTGTPGGHTITQAVPQIVINVLDFGMNIQDAISAPRFAWIDNTDTKLPAEKLTMETRYPPEIIKALQSRGYSIDLIGDWSDGWSAQGIVFDHASGWLIGGSDPRRSGNALGW